MLWPARQHIRLSGQLEALKLETWSNGISHQDVILVANNLRSKPCTGVHNLLRSRFRNIERAEKKRVVPLVIEDVNPKRSALVVMP